MVQLLALGECERRNRQSGPYWLPFYRARNGQKRSVSGRRAAHKQHITQRHEAATVDEAGAVGGAADEPGAVAAVGGAADAV